MKISKKYKFFCCLKKMVIFSAAIIISFVLCPAVCAESENDIDDILYDVQKEAEKSIDKDISEIIEEEDISVSNPKSITDIKAENVFERIISYFTDALKKPFVTLGKIIAVSLVCVIMKSLSDGKSEAENIYGIAGILSAVILMSDTISESFTSLSESIESLNTFMVSYIPVFSSIVSAGGNISTGAGYTAGMLFLCEIMAFVSSKVLVPFLSVVLAVTLVSAVNPKLCFLGIADSVKKCTVWILSAVMTIFVGLISVQGLAGGAVDSASSKAVKFAASSFIPVIGSSVSQAYSTVKGSIGVIRNAAGSVGIIIVFIIVLKPVMTIIAIKFTVWIGQLINDIFGHKRISQFLKSTNSVLSIGLSIMIAYGIVFIVATSMVMIAAANSGG